MHTQPRAPLARCLVATLVAATLVALTGCGRKLQGVYVGTPGNSVFDKIELQSGGRAVVTLIGINYEATYEGKKSAVIVRNPAGEQHELKIDGNGCLVDALGGTYCKDGKAKTAAAPDASDRPSRSSGLSGTYEARAPGGVAMTITFLSATTFSVGTNVPGGMGIMQGTYEVRGDHVYLTVTGDTETLDLTRSGDKLSGNLGGDQVTFVRK